MISAMRIFILTGLVLALGGMESFAQDVQFFEGLQDVPLMPGLTEHTGDTLFYDKPGGRVVELVADMDGFSQEAVQEYYLSALPQFGWKNTAPNSFSRQGESLELAFEADEGVNLLRVLVQPR